MLQTFIQGNERWCLFLMPYIPEWHWLSHEFLRKHTSYTHDTLAFITAISFLEVDDHDHLVVVVVVIRQLDVLQLDVPQQEYNNSLFSRTFTRITVLSDTMHFLAHTCSECLYFANVFASTMHHPLVKQSLQKTSIHLSEVILSKREDTSIWCDHEWLDSETEYPANSRFSFRCESASNELYVSNNGLSTCEAWSLCYCRLSWRYSLRN